MSERHIGTMTQPEQDLADLRTTIQNYIDEGFNMGDSLGALGRLEERLERAERGMADPLLKAVEQVWEEVLDAAGDEWMQQPTKADFPRLVELVERLERAERENKRVREYVVMACRSLAIGRQAEAEEYLRNARFPNLAAHQQNDPFPTASAE